MKNLTPRALNYLRSLQRDTNAVTDKGKLEYFFINQNIPLFEPVIDFGVCYSGLTLRTAVKKGDAFSALLISSQDIKANRLYDFEKEEENFLFYCGNHETAQFNFYINQLGQFCSDGYTGANVLSSSFELEVEQYAFKNELIEWREHPYYYELCNIEELKRTANSGFNILKECSDDYNTWYISDDVIIQKGVWLHEPSCYVHFWGRTDEAVKKIIRDFKTVEIIKSTS